MPWAHRERAAGVCPCRARRSSTLAVLLPAVGSCGQLRATGTRSRAAAAGEGQAAEQEGLAGR